MEKTDFPNWVLNKDPLIDPDAFIARGAQVMGDVRLGKHASVWYNSVLRGDINYIEVGEGSNIQDGSVLHVENDRACIVKNFVTVGHNAMIHACVIEDACLIGIGAIILSGCHVATGCVIGAGALLKEGTVTEPNTLWVGVPARSVKVLDKDTLEKNRKWADKYAKLALAHKTRFGQQSPLV